MLVPEMNNLARDPLKMERYDRPKDEYNIPGSPLRSPSHKVYDHHLENLADAFFKLDRQYRVIYLNPKAKRLFKPHHDKLLGKAIWQVCPETQRSGFHQELKQVSEQQKTTIFEFYYPQTQTWFEVRALGTDSGISIYFLDITKYKKPEIRVINSGRHIIEKQDSLQQREEFLQSIYDGVETSIFVVDVLENGKFCYVGINAAREKVLGISSEEIRGKTPQEILEADLAQEVCDRYCECVKTGKPISYEQSLTINGVTTWWETTLSPLKNSRGVIDRLVGTSNNITERKQTEDALREQATQLELALQQLKMAQAQLVQNEKMSSLGQLVAGIAHEINNPTNFIYGNLLHANSYTQDLVHLIKLYQRYLPHSIPEIEKFTKKVELEFILDDLPTLFESMKAGTERIRQIVLSLRNFSRLDEDGLKSVNIHEGIDNALMLLQHRLTGKQDLPEIQVIKNYGNLPSVECCPGQLNQVFMNLLLNAIDALEMKLENFKVQPPPDLLEEGNVCFLPSDQDSIPSLWIQTEVLKKQSRVAIRIRDNGLGMNAEILSRLFDPFFTTKPVGKGTGLGLSICYQIIVTKHHGVLDCISEPGKGSEFIIELPIFRRRH